MNKSIFLIISFLLAFLITGVIAIFMFLKAYDSLTIAITSMGVFSAVLTIIGFVGQELIMNWGQRFIKKIKGSTLKIRNWILGLYKKLKNFIKTWVCTRICLSVLPEVFVHANGEEDMKTAGEIMACLKKHRINCIPPPDPQKNPQEMRYELEQNLLFCQAVIIVYEHNSDFNWFEQTLKKCRHIAASRDKPLKIMAYSTTNKSLNGTDLAPESILTCHSNDPQFKSFLRKLKCNRIKDLNTN
jgi:hypothetical protein